MKHIYPLNFTAGLVIALGLSLSLSSASSAQSVTIFGGSAAHDCYENAVFSVRLSDASRHDLKKCNDAIIQGRLNRRDLTATYINRGIINVHIGDINQAESDYLTALEMSDRTPETFVNLGNLQYMMQNYHRAVDDYDHAESLGFRQQHILFLNRGMALARLGSFDEAEAEYQKALQLRPDWSLAIDMMTDLDEKRREAAEEAAAREFQ